MKSRNVSSIPGDRCEGPDSPRHAHQQDRYGKALQPQWAAPLIVRVWAVKVETVASPDGGIVTSQQQQPHQCEEASAVARRDNLVDPDGDGSEKGEGSLRMSEPQYTIMEREINIPCASHEAKEDKLPDVCRAGTEGSRDQDQDSGLFC